MNRGTKTRLLVPQAERESHPEPPVQIPGPEPLAGEQVTGVPVRGDDLKAVFQGHSSATLPSLTDHLIRPRQQRPRDRQAEGLCGVEIDDQIERRRLFDGQVARLGTFEDLVHVDGGPA